MWREKDKMWREARREKSHGGMREKNSVETKNEKKCEEKHRDKMRREDWE